MDEKIIMRSQTSTFVTKFLEEKYIPTNVLDVGSRHINANLRELFVKSGIEYLGVDMIEGDNVDEVVNGHDLKEHFGDRQFDMVICFDTLEHDDKFWLTVENMKAILRPGGWLLIGVPGRACPAHDHPHDYWRFMLDGIKTIFDGMVDIYLDAQIDHPDHGEYDEIYGWGQKI